MSVATALRDATRACLRSPRLTVPAIVLLAVGIGLNTAIFSVLHAVLLRPLPYRDADRIFRLFEQDLARGQDRLDLSLPAAKEWASRSRCLEAVSAMTPSVLTVDGGRGPEVAFGILVARGYFDVFGTPALLGRTIAAGSFSEVEAEPRDSRRASAREEVVLSHGFWRDSLGGDPDVLGKSLLISKRPFTIVGVMPADFLVSIVKLWVPLESLELLAPDFAHLVEDREARIFNVHTRVRADCDEERIRADLASTAQLLAHDFPDTHDGVTARLADLRHNVAARRPALLLLQAAGIAVLLVVGINYAYLLSVDRIRRAREIGIRAALGARPRELAGSLALQSLLTTLAGGMLGALLGVALIRVWIARSLVFLPGSEHIGLHIPVLLVAIGSVLLVGVLAALAPAWRLRRIDAGAAMLRGQPRAGGSAPRFGPALGRSSTIVVQTTAAVALLVVTALLVRSLGRLLAVDSGFSPGSIVTLTVGLPFDEYSGEDLARFYASALVEVEGLPQVDSATVIGDRPLEGTSCRLTLVSAPGSTLSEPRETSCVGVGPRFPETLRATLLRGRSLRAPDDYQALLRVVINASLAELLWPGEDALGRSLVIQRRPVDFPDAKPQTVEVVGVLADILHNAPATPRSPAVYLPAYWYTMTFLVRTRGEPSRVSRAVKEAIWRVDPDLPFSRVETLETTVARSTSEQRNGARLVGLFGAAALLNAAFGLFAVLASQVSSRRRELAIRLALGASPRRLANDVLATAAVFTLIGCALGLMLAASLAPLLSKLLYGTSPADGLALTAAPAVMLLAALAASYFPARSAARVDPGASLRAE